MMPGHTNCSCPLCCPAKYQIRPYVAPNFSANVCARCGGDAGSTAHVCLPTPNYGGGHNHNMMAAGLAYEYLKDQRYREMILALAAQYPSIPLAEIIKDLLAGRGAS